MSYLGASKIFNHPREYLFWFENGYTKAPITIKIDLTNRCNHSCYYCIDKSLRGSQDLDFNCASKLIKDLCSMGVKGVHFTGGGEPLLHPRAIDIIAEANKKGLECGLITNGSLLETVDVKKLCHNLSWLRVSLDSHNQESYEANHGKNVDFNKTIRGITKVVDCGLCDVSVSHLTGIKKQNIDLFIKKMEQIGVNTVQISPLINGKKDEQFEKYDSKKIKVIVNKEKYLSKKRTYDFCHGQNFKSTNVCADGSVYVCCQLAGKDNAFIGNLKNKSFPEIWSSFKRKVVVKNINVSKCPKMCVCDSLNTILHDIKNLRHINSL